MEHKITALIAQKRNRQRINIYLDGDFAFGLSRFVAAWLHVGENITDSKIAELIREDALETSYQIALRYINYRPRTETEMRGHLRKKEIPIEVITETINRLKRNGLINDHSFAEKWIEDRAVFRPRSRKMLIAELRQHGITDEIISQVIERVDSDEDETAFQIAQKQAHRYQGLEWRDFRLKLSRYLLQHGFDYGTTTKVVTLLWEKINPIEKSLENHLELEEEIDLWEQH
jgi:regulatory protein